MPLLPCLVLAAMPTFVSDRSAHINQWGSYDNLVQARFNGPTPIRVLQHKGAYGVGTFNGLDGEMVVLDGQVYQVDGFGEAHIAPKGLRTPFAFVTDKFLSPKTIRVNTPTPLSVLRNRIDRELGAYRGILAFRVDGEFRDFAGRSFAGQLPPFQPFAKIVDRQSLLNYPSLSATLVGFRMPKDVAEHNLNVPGYHFHFLSADRTKGGHLLNATMVRGTIQIVQADAITKR